MNSNIRELNYEDLSDFWEIVVLAGSEGYYPKRKEGRIGWFKKIMDECITIRDGFNPENNGTTTIEFLNGRAKILKGPSDKDKVEISLDVSDFSSLIMGSVNIKTLYRLGLCKISDQSKLDLVEKIFFIGQKPLCTVHI